MISGVVIGAENVKRDLVLPLPLSPFESWMVNNYPTLTGADALAGADPDGDGWSNLEEFGLNTDPAMRGVSVFLYAMKGRDFKVSFTRVCAELNYAVETCTDLGVNPLVWTSFSTNPGSVGNTATVVIP